MAIKELFIIKNQHFSEDKGLEKPKHLSETK